jgi:hypothetical protein
MNKLALSALLKVLNSRMGWSTIAVAVGILGEYIAHFAFSRDKKSRLEWVSTIAFAALVVGGVGGEYWFGKQLSESTDQLQAMSEADVSDANTKAGGANERAGKAIERPQCLTSVQSYLRLPI